MDSTHIPKDLRQRREWIKFQLRLRGITLSGLARELGVSRQALGQTLLNSYPKMERVIAARLDLDPEIIWPERYARRRTGVLGKVCQPSCHVKSNKQNTAAKRRNRH